MTDDDRIAYLNGEEPAGPLDPGERIGLDDLRDLLADPATWAEPTPDLEERVVAAISAVGAPGGSGPIATDIPAEPATTATPSPGATAGARVVPLRRRRTVAAVAALAAVVAIVIGLAVGLSSSGTHRLTYHAALSGTNLAPGASAHVTLTQTLSGWQITLHGRGLPRLDNGQYYQAWLKNKAGILVPIGTFNQPNDVILWSGVAPTTFPTVTVTRQQANGNPASSGQRVLTGTAHEG